MKTKMYVIYDSKAKVYNKPFFMLNDSIAIRAVTDLANDLSTDVGRHPEDFILFSIGEYDDESATLDPIPPQVLARAHELQNLESAVAQATKPQTEEGE
jgi:hypothetical protein